MPNYRLLHANYRTGRRSKKLTELELITWLAYQQSADDFGVCPASAIKLQGDDPWLALRPTKLVKLAMEKLETIGLVSRFEEEGTPYLYQPDWQDWQKIRYPSTSTYPLIPAEHLARCSDKTRAMVAEHARENNGNIRVGDTDLPTANAKANASANASSRISKSTEIIPDDGFEAFWRAFPKKKAKDDALKAWRKLKPDADLQAQIVAAVEVQSRSADWLKDGGQFIPYPATWLHRGQWADQSTEIPQVSGSNMRSFGAIYGTK